MKPMTSPTVETVDLLDLKLLPAWVKGPAEPRSYAGTEGNHHRERRERPARHGRGTPTRSGKRSMLDVQRRTTKPSKHEVGRGRRARRGRDRKDDRPSGDKHAPITRMPLQFAIRFLPYSPAFENVVAQIKSGSVAYSLFALARLFLEKPVGYEVCLTTKGESPLYQLGDNGTVSLDWGFLEGNSFLFGQNAFYKIEVLQTD